MYIYKRFSLPFCRSCAGGSLPFWRPTSSRNYSMYRAYPNFTRLLNPIRLKSRLTSQNMISPCMVLEPLRIPTPTREPPLRSNNEAEISSKEEKNSKKKIRCYPNGAIFYDEKYEKKRGCYLLLDKCRLYTIHTSQIKSGSWA